MKFLSFLLVIVVFSSLTSCAQVSDSEDNSTQSQTSSYHLPNTAPYDGEIKGILSRIDNTKPYENIITKTVDAEELATYLERHSSGLSIEDFNDKYEIECLRQLRDNVVYSIHKTNGGGLLYVFWGNHIKYTWYYVEKPLRYQHFQFIKKGDTIEDVKAIDPVTDIFIALYPDNEALYSKHYLQDGIVTFSYRKENGIYFVDHVAYSKNFMTDDVGFSDGSGFCANILERDFIK